MDGISNFMGNAGILIALGLLGVALAITVIFSLLNLFSDFEGSKKGILGFVALAVLIIIGFALSSVPSQLPGFAIEKSITPGQYKAIGGVINTALIATVLMGVIIVVDFISGLVRR